MVVSVIDPLGVQSQENVELTPVVRSFTDARDSLSAIANGQSWQFALRPMWGGEYTLYVNAIDAAGNLTVNGPYTVKVIAPPGPFKTYLPVVLNTTLRGAYVIYLPLVQKTP